MNIFPNRLHNFLPDHRDLLTALAHPPDGGQAHNLPLTGICSLTLAHPPAACGGAGQISSKKAPSSKLVVLFCCLFAVRGGFEPPVRLPVRQFSKLVV